MQLVVQKDKRDIIRSLAVIDVSRNAVDMINEKGYVVLGVIVKGSGCFRNHVTDELMVAFQASFLPRTLRIAVEDFCSLCSVRSLLYGFGIKEFGSPVKEYNGKYGAERIVSELSIEMIEDFKNGSFSLIR